jgi:DNA-binding MarR family transcriptional regulator
MSKNKRSPDPADAMTEDPREQLGQSFKAATAAVRRLKGRETHRAGALSYAQSSLLFGLALGGARPAGELAYAAELSPATATQMLDALERCGLIERSRFADDKRVVLVSLTERGGQVVAERRAQLEPRWRAALAEFSDRDLVTAAAVLDRIREMFEELAAVPAEPAALTDAPQPAAASA